MTTQLAALAAYLEEIPYNDIQNRYDMVLDEGPDGDLLRVHDNKLYETIYANKVDPANVKESVIETVKKFIRSGEVGNVAYWREFIKIVANFKQWSD